MSIPNILCHSILSRFSQTLMCYPWLRQFLHLTPLIVILLTMTATSSPHINVARELPTIFTTISQAQSLSLLPRSDELDSVPTDLPLPSANDFPLQFALNYGWSVMVGTYSYLYPTENNYFELSEFFKWVQAYALARMLENRPPRCNLRLGGGDLDLGIGMHPQSTVRTVEWSIVYYVAKYILQWVRRGFSGHGALYFRHSSGIWLAVLLQDAGSVGRMENAVLPDAECSTSRGDKTPS